MTPQGALTKIAKKLHWLGKKGDRADLDAYMASEELAMLKQIITGKAMTTVGASYDKALACIEKRHPTLPAGKRAKWDVEMIARFRASWNRHRNQYRVAQELQITERAAIAAYHKFVVRDTPPRWQNPPRKARDTLQQAGHPSSATQEVVLGKAA
jgi:hypothetical protein